MMALTQHPCFCAFQRILAVLVLHVVQYLARRSLQLHSLVAAAFPVLHVPQALDHLRPQVLTVLDLTWTGS